MGKSKKKNYALWALQILLAAFYAMAATPKLMGNAEVVENFRRWGMRDKLHLLIGSLELLGAFGLLISSTAAWAAGGLILLMLCNAGGDRCLYCFAARTTSTVQEARAATADETLPSISLWKRPSPRAPRKIVSALQAVASSRITRRASPHLTACETFSPAARNVWVGAAITLLIQFLVSATSPGDGSPTSQCV
jgi:hypothetical protein